MKVTSVQLKFVSIENGVPFVHLLDQQRKLGNALGRTSLTRSPHPLLVTSR
jgi:hypothetical protein